MGLRPGGAFRTEISEDGNEFDPHITGCFLEVVPGERIMWTDALVDRWREPSRPITAEDQETARALPSRPPLRLRQHPRQITDR
ncbi:hypothetical protein ASG90_16100 [Nocardioides sp. Soil797]|nr:hypothetical protein ASG90_16100 [Nocardioides sp. Soil797]